MPKVGALTNSQPAGTPPTPGNAQLRSGGAAQDELEEAAVLDRLASTVDRARAFAERWEAAYRPEIFSIAMAVLLGQPAGKHLTALSPHVPPSRSQLLASGGEPRGYDHPLNESPAPVAKLALKLGINTEDVDRAVLFGENGRIALIGHVEGTTKRELQTKYALIYCFIKEIALGNALVDIEELRGLCIDHGCYDLANFTGNFRKDVKAGLMREIGVRGSRNRQYRLAKKGLDEAAALLREIAEQ